MTRRKEKVRRAIQNFAVLRSWRRDVHFLFHCAVQSMYFKCGEIRLILGEGLNWSRKHRYLSRRLRKLCCEAAIIAEGKFQLAARWLFPVGTSPSRLARG